MAETFDKTVSIEYEEGGLDLQQEWTPRPPQYVTEDWRPGPRFKAKINSSLAPSKYDSLTKMLFNVGIPRNLSRACTSWFNERLEGVDDDPDPYKRKTTEGEVLRPCPATMARLASSPGSRSRSCGRSRDRRERCRFIRRWPSTSTA